MASVASDTGILGPFPSTGGCLRSILPVRLAILRLSMYMRGCFWPMSLARLGIWRLLCVGQSFFRPVSPASL